MKRILALSIAPLLFIGCAPEEGLHVSSNSSALTQFGTVLDIYDKSSTAGWVFGAPPVGTFQTPADSRGKLKRQKDKLKGKIRTTVRVGHENHAYTMWICGFNKPEKCIGTGDPAWAEDVNMTTNCSLGADLMAPLTGVGINAGNAQEAFCQFADGDVPDYDGELILKGKADPSDLPSAPGYTQLLGGGITQAGIDNGEFALVVQSHGPASSDPVLLDEQLNSFMGACNPTCADEQLVAF